MKKKKMKLLILGGSRLSIEIIEQARKMDIFTIVTDWYPIEKSPAKKLADKNYQISTTDIDALEIMINKEKVDGILTGFTDSTLQYYAKLCERVDLPCYGSLELFELFINKEKYKELCRTFDIPVVQEFYYSIEELKTLDIPTINNMLPLLIKPSDSSGGRGVSICRNIEQIEEAYNFALSYSENKTVIIEKFIEGEEVTLFFLFDDGDIYLSGVGNRHIKSNQGKDTISLPVGYTFPSSTIPKYLETIFPKMKKMLKSVGIQNGMMFAQCLIDEGICTIYDIGYRLTGSLEYKLQEAICGFNPLEMLINFALTGKMVENLTDLNSIVTPYWKKYGYNVSLLIDVGKKIQRIEGIEDIKNYPGVNDAVLAHLENEVLPEKTKGTLNQICLRVFGTSESEEDLIKDMMYIHENFKVYDNDGADIVLSGIEKVDLEGRLM